MENSVMNKKSQWLPLQKNSTSVPETRAHNIQGAMNAVKACSTVLIISKKLITNTFMLAKVIVFASYSAANSDSLGTFTDGIGATANTTLGAVSLLDETIEQTISIGLGFGGRVSSLSSVSREQMNTVLSLSDRTAKIRGVANEIKNSKLLKSVDALSQIKDGVDIGVDVGKTLVKWSVEDVTLTEQLNDSVRIARKAIKTNPVGSLADNLVIAPVEDILNENHNRLLFDIRGHEAVVSLLENVKSPISKAYYASLLDYSDARSEADAVAIARAAQSSYEQRLGLAATNARVYLEDIREREASLGIAGVVCVATCVQERAMMKAWAREIELQISDIEKTLVSPDLQLEFELISIAFVQDHLFEQIDQQVVQVEVRAQEFSEAVSNYENFVLDDGIGLGGSVGDAAENEIQLSDGSALSSQVAVGSIAETDTQQGETTQASSPRGNRDHTVDERRQDEQRKLDLSAVISERRVLEKSKEETEAKLQEARNLVAVLRFNEVEKTQNELRQIAPEIQWLSDRKQASVGFDALQVRQRRIVRDIQRLRAAIQLRQGLTSPSSISSSQVRVLNRYAREFGLVARNGQLPWQLLLLQASRLMGSRTTELRGLVDRIEAIEAAGVFSDADERRFQFLIRREEELERRLDTLDDRTRIAEANVDRLSGELSELDQEIASNSARIEALRRDGDVIDFNNYSVREFAQTDWENYSVFNDYGQIDERPEDQSDIQDEVSIDLVAGLNPDNSSPGDGGNDDGHGDTPDTPYTPTNIADRSEIIGLLAGVSASAENAAASTNNANAQNAHTTTKRNLVVATAPGNGAVRYDEKQKDGSREAAYFVKTTNDTSGYSHLTWGRSNTVLEEYRSEVGATVTMPNMRWMSGTPTALTYFANKTGTADYRGQMLGDFVNNSGEFTSGNVTGDLNLSFNFATSKSSGSGHLDVSGTRWATFTVDGEIGQNTSGHAFAIKDAKLNDPDADSYGNLEGFFFGSNAAEAGGVFEYFKPTGTAAGVWVTKAELSSSVAANWDGVATYIYARDDGNGGTHPSSSTLGISEVNSNKTQLTFRQNNSVTINPGTLGVNANSFSRFSHLGMGSWGSDNSYSVSFNGLRPVQFGHWVAYDATKDLPQTGTASYHGRVIGDYYEPDTDLTRHQAVTGSVELNANFASSAVTGELEIAVDGSHWTTATFGENIASYGDQHGFEGDLVGTGFENTDIRAFFAGTNAEEIGGRFRINSEAAFRNNGTVDGVFGTAQNNAPDLNFSSTLIAHTSTQTTARSVYNIGATIDRVPTQTNAIATISLPVRDGGGTLTTTQVLGSGGFEYTSWGRWGANVDAPNTHTQGGYWAAGNITPTSTVENMTGTATYHGGMIGDFVSAAGARSAATGSMELTADFSNQSVSGQMKFQTANQTASFATLNATISNGSFSQTTSSHGFEGNFFGPNAEEIGGTAWMNDNGGTYNGVFRAAQ